MTTSTSRVNHKHYDEAAALQELLRTSSETINEMNDQYDETKQDEDFDVSFSIVIGGKSIAFILGGPQYQALHCFIESIAEENLYEVDYENMTVK